MNSLQWKDITSYSRSDVERIPSTFSVDLWKLRIVVSANHIAYKGTGTIIMHCSPFYDTYPLTSKNINDAKLEAVSLVKNQLQSVLSELEERE